MVEYNMTMEELREQCTTVKDNLRDEIEKLKEKPDPTVSIGLSRDRIELIQQTQAKKETLDLVLWWTRPKENKQKEKTTAPPNL